MILRPVTLAALIARINRRLVYGGERLCKTRGFKDRAELGDFYLIDSDRARIIGCHIDLEEIGKQLGVFYSGEALISSGSEN